jgi:hypothetical protein
VASRLVYSLNIYSAEALAEADYFTKSELGAVAEFRIAFRAELAKLKNELVYWLVGSVGLSVLINHFGNRIGGSGLITSRGLRTPFFSGKAPSK